MIFISIRFRFVAFHKWPTAPKQYVYLRSLHRHEFHVQAFMPVHHANRDVEFIELKKLTQAKVERKIRDRKTQTWSCEHWAQFIAGTDKFYHVSVCEDGENGAHICG